MKFLKDNWFPISVLFLVVFMGFRLIVQNESIQQMHYENLKLRLENKIYKDACVDFREKLSEPSEKEGVPL
jgi:hypothetical protein